MTQEDKEMINKYWEQKHRIDNVQKLYCPFKNDGENHCSASNGKYQPCDKCRVSYEYELTN